MSDSPPSSTTSPMRASTVPSVSGEPQRLRAPLLELRQRALRGSLLVVMLLELFLVFVSVPVLERVQGIAAAVALGCSLTMTGGLSLWLPVLFLAGGLTLLLLSGTPLPAYGAGFQEMNGVLTMVLVVSLVGTVFQRKPYVEALLRTLRGLIRTPQRQRGLLAFFAQLLGSVMSVAALSVSYRLFERIATRDRAFKAQVAVAALRGYALSTLWSPNQTAFAIAITFTGASLLPTMLAGLAFALPAIVLASFAYPAEAAGSLADGTLTGAADGNDRRQDRRLVAEMLLTIVLLVVAIVTVEASTAIELVHVVPLVALAAVVVGSGGSRQGSRLLPVFRAFYDTLPARKEVSLILAAGFLINALRASGFGTVAVASVLRLIQGLPGNVLWPLPLFVVMMGQLGVPPIPMTIIITSALDPALLGAPPELFTLALMLGVSVALIVSPVSVPLLVQSSVTGYDTIDVGLRWNWRYGIILYIVGELYLQLLAVVWPRVA